MSTLLNFARDVQGYNAYAPQFPTDIFTATLAAGTAESFTVPNNSNYWIMYVRVQPNGWAWISRTATAAVPAGGTFASAKSELVDGTIEFKRIVLAKDTISMITANTTCDVSISLFPISYPY